jgi:hypothetical protein
MAKLMICTIIMPKPTTSKLIMAKLKMAKLIVTNQWWLN